MNLSIATYSDEYCHAVADLFTQAVHAIDNALYSKEQKAAWAPLDMDYSRWQQRLKAERCFLALADKQLLGFIELEDDYIDCFYVAPQYQGQAVGRALYQHIEKIAREKKLAGLRVDASLAAKNFFAQQGFVVVSHNQLLRLGTKLENIRMFKGFYT
ncbi:GNAT family N-acetyltransferase [Agarivorans aestuarii]|uniref:GNAT family N-acetyltransferase n=1 Tax=Agarivorans aestuarii TaxID=1563703 RepID=A0ABU7GAF4_9ALTE|nr:GNAT family N-acetyltransferase [Agarivorans aestuarii]MEE1676235.1 GNAT family N-acetyltransferase [Agarivorans aestuarii]